MKSVEWITYRTRFLVKAKQLSSSLSFVDHYNRLQCGSRGDYLVESYEGVISIVPRRIFEDIYVPMLGGDNLAFDGRSNLNESPTDLTRLDELRIESLRIEKVRNSAFNRANNSPSPNAHDSNRTGRKSPQPVRNPPPRVNLM
jgi:hypothetical protein